MLSKFALFINIKYNILAVRKACYFNIKTKMFDFEPRLANSLREPANQNACLKYFVFMLRWPAFLTASIVPYTI